MNIPFHKPYITKNEIDSVVESIKSGWLTMGPKTFEFEKQFKDYIGCNHAISVNSATSALHLALTSLGIGAGDEVILPTNTFIATAESVLYTGASIVLCDIETISHNLDVKLIESLITPKTKAIIPVHFAGHSCDMKNLLDISNKYSLKIIEDAAHALPTRYKDTLIGNIGDATCFSFYATKTLSTGEGGMVVTNNSDVAKTVKLKRLHGINRDAWNRYDNEKGWHYDVLDLGYKYNLTDIQASIGIEQLKKLEWMCSERERVAKQYINAFIGKINYVRSSVPSSSSWHLFVIKIKNRDELYAKLKKCGINTSVHFIPVHKQKYYKERFSFKDVDYPNANSVFQDSLSLPIYPNLCNTEIDYIIFNVLKYAKY